MDINVYEYLRELENRLEVLESSQLDSLSIIIPSVFCGICLIVCVICLVICCYKADS